MTFSGGSGAATLTGGVMNIVAGSGDITVTGIYGSDVASFSGGSGSATLALDNCGSTITFGTGVSSIHELGWGAAHIYNFLAGDDGADTIANFRPGIDNAVLGAGVTVTSSSDGGDAAKFVSSNGADVTFTGLASVAGIFAS